MINETTYSKTKELIKKYEIEPTEIFDDFLDRISHKEIEKISYNARLTKKLFSDLIKTYNTVTFTTEKFENLSSFTKEIEKNESKIYRTDEPEVNQILEGGFKGGYIYKIIGLPCTGKTTLISSVVKINKNEPKTKILFFSFLNDNISSDILEYINESNIKNITIEENIFSFQELLASSYFQNNGENLKQYNIIIFDPFTLILYKGFNMDYSLIFKFDKIINYLASKYNICFIFSIYAKKTRNNFWYNKDDNNEKSKIILSNYESYDPLPNLPNTVKINLFTMKKGRVVKYLMKVTSSSYKQPSNFIEWDLPD